MSKKQPVNKVLEHLGREVLTPEEKQLLSLATAPSVSQQELDYFLERWDMEAASLHSVILLAYLMKIHPDLFFPDSVQPRLQGVLSYCRFQNLKLSAHFSKIAGKLNAGNIPFVLLKGGAMKVYRPGFPRWMGDIDILVKEQDFAAAEKIVRELGYSALRCAHSLDFRIKGTEEDVLDLHRYIQMNTGMEACFSDLLLARASKVNAFSAECLLPCREDMVFIALVNLYKNLTYKTSTNSVLNTFIDLHHFLGNGTDFNWSIVWDNARKTGSDIQVCLATAFVSSLLPGFLPRESLSGWRDRKEAGKHCLELMYQREIISPLREEIGIVNLVKALRSIHPIMPYIQRRARLFFLKRVCLAAKAGMLEERGLI